MRFELSAGLGCGFILAGSREKDFSEWASLYYNVAKLQRREGVASAKGCVSAKSKTERREVEFLCRAQTLRNFEFHGDLGLNFDGLIVEVVGLVFPLLDRVDCGA